ncbi:MAG: DUF6037 family protein [Bacteroidales bacterium]|jgi:hypothetical protein|nr:DUF6037 family protein [Bacteroidales bacterium]
MKLTGLVPLYKSLRNNDYTYCIFSYVKNSIKFDVFFDIGYSPFRIGFLVLNSDFQLWLDIRLGFYINTKLNKKDFYKLIDILGINSDPDNPFSTTLFFEEFNNKIPPKFKDIAHKERAMIISRIKDIEEEDKIYYKGLIDWEKSENGNRRCENLEKTRLLYPKLYYQIKDKNISVRYTSNKEEAREI